MQPHQHTPDLKQQATRLEEKVRWVTGNLQTRLHNKTTENNCLWALVTVATFVISHTSKNAYTAGWFIAVLAMILLIVMAYRKPEEMPTPYDP